MSGSRYQRSTSSSPSLSPSSCGVCSMPRERKKLNSATKLKLEQIVRLEMLGKSVEEIALSVGLSPHSIAELTNHAEYSAVRTRYVEDIYEPVDALIQDRKAQTILDEAAPSAAIALTHLVHSEDEVTSRLSATAVLDRTGHSPIQRKATKVRHEFDPVTMQLMKNAMKESDTSEIIDVEVEDA